MSVWGKQLRKGRGVQGKGARDPNIHCLLPHAGIKVLGTIKKTKSHLILTTAREVDIIILCFKQDPEVGIKFRTV